MGMNSDRPPLRLLSAAFLLTFVTFSMFGYFSWNSYKNVKESMQQSLRIAELKGTILLYDEVLTMSAKMAPASGDIYWEKRYEKFEPELDLAIKQLISISPESFIGKSAEKTDTANVKLVAMEKQAFKEVRKGNLDKAKALLDSEAYQREKEIYTAGMRQVKKNIEVQTDELIKKQRRQIFLLILSLIVTLPLLIITWIVTYRKFILYIDKRKQNEAKQDKLQSQLNQAQKMESVGRLAGGVAHDFNNMLGIILGYTDMILEGMDPDWPFHADLTEIKKAGERSADLTRQLLAFARKQTVAPLVLDLNESIPSMLKMLQRLIGEDIDLLWKPGPGLWPVKIDPAQIDQILVNLCVNARDAIADVGKVTIETDNIVFDEEYGKEHAGFVPGEYTMMAVSDDGCGMDAEILTHLFEPFFTTKELGKGTGLGLATVYGAVKQNNGFINVYSEPDQGTTFRIYLPRHAAKAAEIKDLKPRASERGSETILLVEDEPAILKMTTRMLEQLGYTVLEALTPGEAIRLAREHAGRIDLLMTDVVMPEMNGRELAKNLLTLYPEMRRLFMSGYTAKVIAHHGALDEGIHFIQKPFSKEDLTVKVRRALEG